MDPIKSEATGAQVFARTLKSHGVQFVFYLCGGSVVPIAIEADKLGIRIIDTRQEATAAFAAKTVGRLTGTPGVVIVTSGPGLTNTVTAAQEALSDETPLIIISGAVPIANRGIRDLQDINHIRIMKTVCKAVYSIENKESIIWTIKEAFKEAVSNTPGPIYIQVPLDVLITYKFEPLPYTFRTRLDDGSLKTSKWLLDRAASIVQTLNPTHHGSEDTSPLKPTYPKASDSQIHHCVELIKGSKKPVIILGAQATLLPQQVVLVTKALELIAIPCFAQSTSKGLLGKDHPLLLAHDHKMKEAFDEADLVILAGAVCDYTLRYGLDLPREGAKVIAVNRNTDDLHLNSGKFWHMTQGVQSDVGYFLIQVSDGLKKFGYACPPSWTQTLKDRDSAYWKFLEEKRLERTGTHMNPVNLLMEIRSAFPANGVVVFDRGDFADLASSGFVLPTKPLSCMDPGPLAAVGGSAGYALAAKLCYPDRDVWAIVGDGSLGYTVIEFDTFRRHNVGVVFVVGSNAEWHEVGRGEAKKYDTTIGAKLNYRKYNEIASTLGGTGFLVDEHNEGELPKILKEVSGLSKSGSVLVNVLMGQTDLMDGYL